MSSIFLVARREYLAYVSAWGFWLSMVSAPLLGLLLVLGPTALARAEPSRVLTIVAQQPSDAATVNAAFADLASRESRAEINAYLSATAPEVENAALQAYDAAPNRTAAIAAARSVVARQAPDAIGAFPRLSPRYEIISPPSRNIEAMRPYLDGSHTLPDGRRLYGALDILRDKGVPVIQFWSVNLSQDEPSSVAADAMRLVMRREALAQSGVSADQADRLESLRPTVAQFDPRPQAGAGEVTLRERAPYYAALALAFVLWTVVFSVGNMLLSGIIEEKSNKILDTLLTSVSPVQLLAGKLLGVAAVSATLFLIWGVLGGTLLHATTTHDVQSVISQIAVAFLDPRLLAAFAVGFVAGYLMYGAIFLALGSLCESMQDAQTLMGPLLLLLAIPMMLVTPAMDNPNAPLVAAGSWIPLFTPFLLLVRAPAGLSWLEIAGMGAMMAVTVVIVLILASRVFKAGIVDQVSIASWRRKKN